MTTVYHSAVIAVLDGHVREVQLAFRILDNFSSMALNLGNYRVND